MTHTERKAYDFNKAEHWRAGARQGLALNDDQLNAAQPVCVEAIAGSGGDGGSLPAWDRCGRQLWLRPTGELMRRYPFGVENVGHLENAIAARQIVVGGNLLWLLHDRGVERIALASLEYLSLVTPEPGWFISAIASDGDSGLWLAEATADETRLRHVDCWGRSCRDQILLIRPFAASTRIAASADGRWVAAIDSGATSDLLIVDTTSEHSQASVALDGEHATGPTALTLVDGQVSLLTSRVAKNYLAANDLLLEVFSLDGEVEDLQVLELPASIGVVTGVAAGDEMLLAGTRGLAILTACEGRDDQLIGTFITPGLFSQDVQGQRWNRAEVDLVLPPGTAVEIAWAATDDRHIIRRADDLFSGPVTATRVAQLDTLLPWTSEQTVRYDAGTAPDDTVERLAALLDEVDDGTLWIRVRLYTPRGRTPPVLKGLQVVYPHDSYLEDLPAVYREDPKATIQLRKILAPIELLYDGIDDSLAALPDRIDPETAPDEWTPFLLEWLGFPPLGDLAPELRRALLKHTPALLACRGTIATLELALDIVTGGRSTVTDSAAGPAIWFLPSASTQGSAHLGVDTLVAAQQPSASRAGAMVLGATPVGTGCTDPALVLSQRARIITIQFDLDAESRRVLEPILDRLLRFFVPAHCRLAIVYSAIDARFRSAQLDVDFILAAEADDTEGDRKPRGGLLYSDAHWQLGATARLGDWRLADPIVKPARIGANVLTDSNAHLN